MVPWLLLFREPLPLVELLPDVELLPEVVLSELIEPLPLVEPAGVCNVPLAEPDGLVWIDPEAPLLLELLGGVVLTDPLLFTEPEPLVVSVPAPPR